MNPVPPAAHRTTDVKGPERLKGKLHLCAGHPQLKKITSASTTSGVNVLTPIVATYTPLTLKYIKETLPNAAATDREAQPDLTTVVRDPARTKLRVAPPLLTPERHPKHLIVEFVNTS